MAVNPASLGMRITVYDVLEYLASDMSQEEILEDFPYLTKTDIIPPRELNCLA